jgi:hypothetical protein
LIYNLSIGVIQSRLDKREGKGMANKMKIPESDLTIIENKKRLIEIDKDIKFAQDHIYSYWITDSLNNTHLFDKELTENFQNLILSEKEKEKLESINHAIAKYHSLKASEKQIIEDQLNDFMVEIEKNLNKLGF